jgi:hypothetical protein
MSRRTLALAISMLVLSGTLATAPASASETGGDPWEPPIPASDPARTYLVVAPEGWETFLRPLMDWRDQTSGHTSEFMSMEQANADGVGRDRAARLRSMVRDAGPDALLLVGDSEVLPVRYVFTDILQDGNESDPLNFRWTDDYYAIGRETEWDRDGDGVYGEDGEVFEEIAQAYEAGEGIPVGRVPASSELEVERFVDKLLAYERSPPPGDWFTSALVVSGLMDVPNDLDNPYTPDLDGGYELFSDNAYESHEKLQAIIPERFERTWLYDYPRLDGGHWNRSTDILDHDTLVSAFDEGHSVVAMNGHGYIDGSGLAHYNGSGYSNYWWDWHGAYDYADADNASNDGRLPWVYVAACYVGDITVDDDKTLERMVMNPHGGAIGLVAGNGENYKGESITNASFGNWFLERHFWTYYMQEGPGFAMLHTKADYLALISGDALPHTPLYDAYYVADYLSPNLLGDPLTMVWTDVPDTLRISSFRDDEVSGEAVLVTVVDGSDEPVRDASVYIGWDGNSTLDRTDGTGTVRLWVPLDAGGLEVVVSARDHLPASAQVERPVNTPDLALARVSWIDGEGNEGQPVLNGDEVTLRAHIDVLGRYDYDQARVRFSVAPANGDFERLVPDVFAAVWTGEDPVAETTWTPPWPGTWQVRAEVNPAGELPERTISNNLGQTTLAVQGQPRWATLPASVSLWCGDGPATEYDLLVHVSDPDTPPEDLVISAVAAGALPDGVTFQVVDGHLVVCSRDPRASMSLDLEVSDGTYSDDARLLVEVGRTAPRLRLAGETFHTATQGADVTGSLSIVNLGPGKAEDGLSIVDLSGNLLFSITPGGDYTFEANVPGTYQVRVGIQRADGTSEPSWEPTILSFKVLPDSGWPPQAYGWPDLEIAEGEKVTVHLQALDLEGGSVTYELVDGDGLDASIDPDTGMLTIRPGEGDGGRHRLTVSLSDGTSSEEYVLQVFVTDAPTSGKALWIVVGLGVGLLAVGVVFMVLRHRRDGN